MEKDSVVFTSFIYLAYKITRITARHIIPLSVLAELHAVFVVVVIIRFALTPVCVADHRIVTD